MTELAWYWEKIRAVMDLYHDYCITTELCEFQFGTSELNQGGVKNFGKSRLKEKNNTK